MRIAVLLLVFATGPASAAVVNVSDVTQLQSALKSAQAGDEIVLASGTYTINANLDCSANGTAQTPIVVRSQTPLGAHLRFNALEGFRVTGRFWTFDGLDIEGICAVDADCEHAFHVSGAESFTLRNSRVRDFNAQLKVNAIQVNGAWVLPHRGLVEGNELFDSRSRNTSNPVTKLNIDTGDDWVVRDNFIHDFHKNGGDFISYGAFMKSGGNRGLFARNLVICARDLVTGGTRIGLSFGGGGTANAYCAPAFNTSVPCDPEHTDGVMQNNVIVNCSDVGIYLNKATNTQVLFNTLIANNGVDYRFGTSTGEAHGNVLSSVVRPRNGGTFTEGTNQSNVPIATFNSWYRNPLLGDLRINGDVSSLIGKATPRANVSDDYCGRTRPSTAYTLGALEHSLGNCYDGGSGGDDAGVQDDGGVGSDSGMEADGGGGIVDPPGRGSVDQPASGCGCGAGASSASLLALIAVIAAGLRPR